MSFSVRAKAALAVQLSSLKNDFHTLQNARYQRELRIDQLVQNRLSHFGCFEFPRLSSPAPLTFPDDLEIQILADQLTRNLQSELNREKGLHALETTLPEQISLDRLAERLDLEISAALIQLFSHFDLGKSEEQSLRNLIAQRNSGKKTSVKKVTENLIQKKISTLKTGVLPEEASLLQLSTSIEECLDKRDSIFNDIKTSSFLALANQSRIYSLKTFLRLFESRLSLLIKQDNPQFFVSWNRVTREKLVEGLYSLSPLTQEIALLKEFNMSLIPLSKGVPLTCWNTWMEMQAAITKWNDRELAWAEQNLPNPNVSNWLTLLTTDAVLESQFLNPKKSFWVRQLILKISRFWTQISKSPEIARTPSPWSPIEETSELSFKDTHEPSPSCSLEDWQTKIAEISSLESPLYKRWRNRSISLESHSVENPYNNSWIEALVDLSFPFNGPAESGFLCLDDEQTKNPEDAIRIRKIHTPAGAAFAFDLALIDSSVTDYRTGFLQTGHTMALVLTAHLQPNFELTAFQLKSMLIEVPARPSGPVQNGISIHWTALEAALVRESVLSSSSSEDEDSSSSSPLLNDDLREMLDSFLQFQSRKKKVIQWTTPQKPLEEVEALEASSSEASCSRMPGSSNPSLFSRACFIEKLLLRRNHFEENRTSFNSSPPSYRKNDYQRAQTTLIESMYVAMSLLATTKVLTGENYIHTSAFSLDKDSIRKALLSYPVLPKVLEEGASEQAVRDQSSRLLEIFLRPRGFKQRKGVSDFMNLFGINSPTSAFVVEASLWLASHSVTPPISSSPQYSSSASTSSSSGLSSDC